MPAQMTTVGIENGTSVHIAPDVLSGVGADTFAGAYISDISYYVLGTRVELSWALMLRKSWAFGLNGQTLTFSAADFFAKLRKPLAQVRIREKNQRVIALLEEWFSEPDDMGSVFWEKFDKDLEADRFTI